jgi:hypothetical protein
MRLTLIALGAALAIAPAASFAQTAAPSAPAASSAASTLPGAAQAAAFKTDTTTVGDIMDNPAALAVVKTHLAGLFASDQIEMARGMTLKALQQYAAESVTDKALAAIDADFASLAKK